MYSGHSTTDLSPKGRGARSGFAGSGDEVAVDADQVLEPVDLGPRERQPPGAVVPRERRPGARPRDLLPEHHLAEAVLGIGQREVDRVLPDAGRAQRFFFGLF